MNQKYYELLKQGLELSPAQKAEKEAFLAEFTKMTGMPLEEIDNQTEELFELIFTSLINQVHDTDKGMISIGYKTLSLPIELEPFSHIRKHVELSKQIKERIYFPKITYFNYYLVTSRLTEHKISFGNFKNAHFKTTEKYMTLITDRKSLNKLIKQYEQEQGINPKILKKQK